MAFLTGTQIEKEIAKGNILITSLDPHYPFKIDKQVTEDSIDLRLAPMGLIYKSGLVKIDYKQGDLDSFFRTVMIPVKGYELKPGQVLFTQTLEAVSLPETMVGLVVTRSTFARIGISVNGGAPKFGTGINWAFPLQVVNMNSLPVIIYPYTIIAQLMVSYMDGPTSTYQGRYQNTYLPIPPRLSDGDLVITESSLDPDQTFQMIYDEIHEQGKVIKLLFEDTREQQKSSGLLKKERLSRLNTLIIVGRIALGIIGSVTFAVVGNLISEGDWSYWKIVSVVLLSILGLAITIGAIFIKVNDARAMAKENDPIAW